MTATIRFTTASGSRYVMDHNTLTRLSERPIMRCGQPDFEVLSSAEVTHVIEAPAVGQPFCAIVNGDRLKTTRVTEIDTAAEGMAS